MSQQYPQDNDPRRQQPPWDYSQKDYYSPNVQQNVQQHIPPGWRGNSFHDQQHTPPEPHYQPPRRRRGLAIAGWAIGAVVLLAVSAGATVVLRHHTAAAAKPLTCKQQYTAWKTGPVRPKAQQLVSDARALSKSNDDIPVMTSDLKALGADAAAMEAYPMPRCADPKGYWPQYLADIKAAGDNAGSTSGLGGLLLAEAPMKNVKQLQSKLSAELVKTAGIKPS